MTKYIPPYSLLHQVISYNETLDTFEVPASIFKELIKSMASAGGFDEDWYEIAYSDVADAISSGLVSSPLIHYAESGYFEGRRPRNLPVDDEWYLAQYSDVKNAVESGKVSSAHAHFNTTGYFEGRASSAQDAEMVEFWRAIASPRSKTT